MKTRLFGLVAAGVVLTGCGATMTPSTSSLPASPVAQVAPFDLDGQPPTYRLQAIGDGPGLPGVLIPGPGIPGSIFLGGIFPLPTIPTNEPDAKPIFKLQRLTANLHDTEATPFLVDGGIGIQPTTRVWFDLEGTHKLKKKSQAFTTSGSLTFRDVSRRLRFRGKVDGSLELLLGPILIAGVQGSLDDGRRFNLIMGQISPYAVEYAFEVTTGVGMPLYRYHGVAEKGKLKFMRR